MGSHYIIKSILILAAVAAAIGAGSAQAATITEGTFRTAGDTTIITDGSTSLEFLDARFTTGMTLATADSFFAADGFPAATYAQAQVLLSAFGFGNVAFPTAGKINKIFGGDLKAFFATAGTNFNSQTTVLHFVSPTGGVGLFCVSTGACTVDNGIFNRSDLNGHKRMGALLVRAPSMTPVPLPAGAVLLLTGLGGLVVARRRKAA